MGDLSAALGGLPGGDFLRRVENKGQPCDVVGLGFGVPEAGLVVTPQGVSWHGNLAHVWQGHLDPALTGKMPVVLMGETPMLLCPSGHTTNL